MNNRPIRSPNLTLILSGRLLDALFVTFDLRPTRVVSTRISSKIAYGKIHFKMSSTAYTANPLHITVGSLYPIISFFFF